jgi:hypothetical protein
VTARRTVGKQEGCQQQKGCCWQDRDKYAHDSRNSANPSEYEHENTLHVDLKYHYSNLVTGTKEKCIRIYATC